MDRSDLKSRSARQRVEHLLAGSDLLTLERAGRHQESDAELPSKASLQSAVRDARLLRHADRCPELS